MYVRAAFVSLAVLCSFSARAVNSHDPRGDEGPRLALHEIASADQWFTARVPAELREVRKAGARYRVTLDIGSDAPILCTVVPNGFNMAATLRENLKQSMEEVGARDGTVDVLHLEATDAGAIDEAPFLAARWSFGVRDANEFSRPGELKQVVFTRYGHGVYCSHRDTGYTQAFDAVTRAFAETFRAPLADAAPYFVEIKTASASGVKLGVIVYTLTDAAGFTTARQATSMLIRQAGSFHAHDTHHVELLQPDDSLLRASDEILSDGDAVLRVELNRRGDEWEIRGERNGMPISATLPPNSRPGSWLTQAHELRDILSAQNPEGAEHSLPMWISSRPTALINMRTRVLAQTSPDAFAARIIVPHFESELVLDRGTGLPLSMEVPRGEQVVHVERVFIHGNL